jgi:mRNA interferase RelE/StbE
MKTSFRKSFARDPKKIKDRTILGRIQQAMEEVEAIGDFQQVSTVKRMSGGGSYFRIRVGDYRIDLSVEGDEVESVPVFASSTPQPWAAYVRAIKERE